MPALYLTEQGSLLRHEERRLIVEKDGQELHSIALTHVDEVVVMGNIGITMPTMKLFLREGIDVALLTQDGDYCGRLSGPLTRGGSLRRLQYACANNDTFSMSVARACVSGKLHNLHTMLLRYNRDLRRPEIEDACERIASYAEAAESAESRNVLMGYEGSATAEYFGQFPALFKRHWEFDKRARRPPPDPVNVLLSFGYTLLGKAVQSAIETVGLDPCIGYLHETVVARVSLPLDLIEEFRPIIADSVALRCLNSDIVKPEDFTSGDDPNRPVVFSQDGIKRFLAEFELRLNTEISHPDTAERVTYRRALELQARRLAAAVNGRDPYRAFTVR